MVILIGWNRPDRYPTLWLPLVLILIFFLRGVEGTAQDNSGSKLMAKAKASIAKRDYDSARVYAEAAVKISEQNADMRSKADALSTLGKIFEFENDFSSSQTSYFDAIKIYNGLGDKKGAGLLREIVNQYRTKESETDKRKLISRLKVAEAANEVKQLPLLYNNVGILMIKAKKYDSALFYLTKLRKASERTSDKFTLGVVTLNIGDVYEKVKAFDSAIYYYRWSESICNEINDREGSFFPQQEMGDTYFAMGEFSKAERCYQNARAIAETLSDPWLQQENYLALSRLDSALQNYKMAYHWYKLYSRLNDSHLTVNNSRLVYEVTTKFESEKNDQAVNFLKQEQRSYGIILVVSFLLSGTLLFLVIYKIRTERKLSLQKEEVMRKNTKLYEVNLALENAIQEKDGLIGVVAHDLRSPLAKTTGLIGLISSVGPITAEQGKMILMIKKVCEEGNSLIKDLLEMNALENKSDVGTELNTFEVGSYVDTLVSLHNQKAAEKKIRIETELLIPQGQMLKTNSEYLTRILDNLLSNAMKFSKPNTVIFLRVELANEKLFFRVRDQGPGIREEEKAQLFKKFKKLSARPTAGESSTGLGLSIVKTLVDRLGGSIEVESVVGVGATFIISLPIARSN